jgi:PhnB protein
MLKGVPDNSSVVMPRLFCRDVAAEIDFCKYTFDAEDLGHRPGPDGTPAHALLTIGPAMIMIEAEWPGLSSRAPALDGSSPVVIFVYVEDVDKTVERAVTGGAKILFPVQNQFWGDRIGWVMDPSGHVWTIATRIEETTEEQRKDRWSAALAKSDPGTVS